MIQQAARCPRCGAGHNPLVQPSFRDESEQSPAEGAEPAEAAETTTYTWFCEVCGESYQLDGSSGRVSG